MNILFLLILSVSLAMDAFAVSISAGMAEGRPNARVSLKLGGAFGVFQGLMPLIGYLLANTVVSKLTSVANWVAGLLLIFIGVKMLIETREDESLPKKDLTGWKNVLVLAVATSLDALAAGVSIAMMPKTGVMSLAGGVWIACGVIAAVTAVICFTGCQLGSFIGKKVGKKAELAGGIVLILIAIKLIVQVWF